MAKPLQAQWRHVPVVPKFEFFSLTNNTKMFLNLLFNFIWKISYIFLGDVAILVISTATPIGEEHFLLKLREESKGKFYA